jgi:hypothetical protein
MANASTTTRARSHRMHGPLGPFLAQVGTAPGAVGDLPGQLTASCIDIITARTAQHGEHAGIEQLLLESRY